MKNIFKINCFFGAVITFCCGWLSPSLADVGGGSGRAHSPYIEMQLPEDNLTVRRLKAEAAATRTVNFTTSYGKSVYGKRIGIVYAKPGAFLGSTATHTAFFGIVDGETTPRYIDFSIIRNVTILKKDYSSITLKLDLFPDIAVEELLKKRPSYTELKSKYTKTITIWVWLWSEDNQPLALVGSGSEENAPRKIIALFSEIPNAQKIEFLGPDNYWWAIRSVTDDLAYPRPAVHPSLP